MPIIQTRTPTDPGLYPLRIVELPFAPGDRVEKRAIMARLELSDGRKVGIRAPVTGILQAGPPVGTIFTSASPLLQLQTDAPETEPAPQAPQTRPVSDSAPTAQRPHETMTPASIKPPVKQWRPPLGLQIAFLVLVFSPLAWSVLDTDSFERKGGEMIETVTDVGGAILRFPLQIIGGIGHQIGKLRPESADSNTDVAATNTSDGSQDQATTSAPPVPPTIEKIALPEWTPDAPSLLVSTLDLAAADNGKTPKRSAEQQKAFDAWMEE